MLCVLLFFLIECVFVCFVCMCWCVVSMLFGLADRVYGFLVGSVANRFARFFKNSVFFVLDFIVVLFSLSF